MFQAGEIMIETIIKILSAIAIAGASSWITVQLSRHKFRTEKWWEKKVSAYERVIDAFHSSKKFTSEHLDAEYKGHEVEESRDQELRSLAKKARDEILRSHDVGSFILSPNSLQILEQYEEASEKLSECHSWQEYLHLDWKVTDQHMKEFIAEAKRDLSC